MPDDTPDAWPHPAYRIETARLVLRCYQPEDAAEMTRVLAGSREHLVKWIPWADRQNDLATNVALLRRFRGNFDLGNEFVYGVYDAITGAQVGGCGLHARIGPRALEIGYWIAPDRVRQGLATEASAALTRVGFEVLCARRMEIRCDPGNVASAGVPRKLGYTHDGVLRWTLAWPDGSMRDTAVFTMTADDYPASPAAAAIVRATDCLGQPLLG